MKKLKYILFCVFLISIAATCEEDGFKSLSKDVDRVYRQGRDVDGLTFHDLRMKYCKAAPIKLKDIGDTIYFLEQQTLEDWTYAGLIWSKNFRRSFTYSSTGKLRNPATSGFTEVTEILVSKWDTTSIRHEELKFAISFPNTKIYATRVILKDRSYQIDTISFKKFFSIDRDIR